MEIKINAYKELFAQFGDNAQHGDKALVIYDDVGLSVLEEAAAAVRGAMSCVQLDKSKEARCSFESAYSGNAPTHLAVDSSSFFRQTNPTLPLMTGYAGFSGLSRADRFYYIFEAMTRRHIAGKPSALTKRENPLAGLRRRLARKAIQGNNPAHQFGALKIPAETWEKIKADLIADFQQAHKLTPGAAGDDIGVELYDWVAAKWATRFRERKALFMSIYGEVWSATKYQNGDLQKRNDLDAQTDGDILYCEAMCRVLKPENFVRILYADLVAEFDGVKRDMIAKVFSQTDKPVISFCHDTGKISSAGKDDYSFNRKDRWLIDAVFQLAALAVAPDGYRCCCIARTTLHDSKTLDAFRRVVMFAHTLAPSGTVGFVVQAREGGADLFKTRWNTSTALIQCDAIDTAGL